MRITAGIAKGREVPAPKGVDLRPTSDKVKQALFNLLGRLVQEAAVLDFFCGSGNLGLEALSRGAASACFVDKDERCLESARSSVHRMGLDPGNRCDYIKADAVQALSGLAGARRLFSLVLVDPPYASGLSETLLLSPNLVAIVARGEGSRLVLEHDAKQDAPLA